MRYGEQITRAFGTRANKWPMFSFWSHFPEADMDADLLAETTVNFQREYDLDFVKTAPNGMYAIEDLGVTIDVSKVAMGGVAQIVATPFETPTAWYNLPEADISRGALARELRSLRLIRAALPDVPIIFTIFSPMTLAAKLSRGKIYTQIAQRISIDAVHFALRRLAHGVRTYARTVIEAGADGVFFAHQDTGRHLLSYDDFQEFVAPYDVEALLGAQTGRFNILHVHGEQIRFHEVKDYPVHALNWHHWETRPSAAAGMLASGKCVVGGIDRWSITRNDVAALRNQIIRTIEEVGQFGDLILAPSCTIRAGFSSDTLHAVQHFIRSLAVNEPALTQPAFSGALVRV
jgi:uroporphyrinogen decarboxylase